MKLEERSRARELRFKGLSIKQIASMLDVSKWSVSSWVRDIELTTGALANIQTQRRLGREQSRKTRLSNIAKVNADLALRCKEEILPLSKRDLWIAGLMVYAGEGNKSPIVSRQRIEVVNSDPNILRIFINFLINICSVPRDKIRVRLMLYTDIDLREAPLLVK